ncbi:hypothetical protein KM176_16530 [Pseudooceanicola sp. CBS1P-1]|uniref:Uncharacterized protein n=1 Tax=Pseudooceanicola albus TaxID=2692189 RepID=A0A6L7G6T4_9RHOB|nr:MULTISPECIES: hypothetical protein [Pseudooceanicola]MBT9385482.1 hypothetical protein [Pseudooceanicola endophyticus]MXN19106.1 hypothetical protein [Pseudooceanicola albus]
MAELRALATIEDAMAEDVIQLLEDALEFARSHPQRCVSIFSIGRDEVRNHLHCGMGMMELVGSMEDAKFRILTEED